MHLMARRVKLGIVHHWVGLNDKLFRFLGEGEEQSDGWNSNYGPVMIHGPCAEIGFVVAP